MHNAIADHTPTNVQPVSETEQGQPPSQTFQFYCSACGNMVWNIPLGSLDQVSWFCPLPVSCTPPASSLAEQHEKQKNSCLCVSTALQQVKATTKPLVCYWHNFSPKSKTCGPATTFYTRD